VGGGICHVSSPTAAGIEEYKEKNDQEETDYAAYDGSDWQR